MVVLENGLYKAHCLTLLERLSDHSVDFVYIDPPWFTGNIFKGTEDEYRYFMRIVIKHFKRVLKETGNLFLHITPQAGNYIRPLMFEIFSPENFRPEINIPRLGYAQFKSYEQGTHEHILHYAMSEQSTHNRLFRPLNNTELRRYKKDPTGKHYVLSALTRPSNDLDLRYEFRTYRPPNGHSWIYSEAKMQELWGMGKIEESSSGNTIMLKRYATDQQIDFTDEWHDVPLIDKDKKKTFKLFDPRPVELIEKLIRIATNEGDVVLDVFAGSGSTLGAANRLGRRWIGCDIVTEMVDNAQRWLEDEIGIDWKQDAILADDVYLRENFDVIRKYGKFFLSYKSTDREQFVRPFHNELLEWDIDHWWDQKDIPAGTEWEKRIEQGLKECDALILFMTPDSMQSEWVQREYETFLKAGKGIFPIVCKETVGIPTSILRFQYTLYDDFEKKLLPELLKFNPDIV